MILIEHVQILHFLKGIVVFHQYETERSIWIYNLFGHIFYAPFYSFPYERVEVVYLKNNILYQRVHLNNQIIERNDEIWLY